MCRITRSCFISLGALLLANHLGFAAPEPPRSAALTPTLAERGTAARSFPADRNRPGGCGLDAVLALARAVGTAEPLPAARGAWQVPATGFSISDLARIARSVGLETKPVRRSEGAGWPTPGVMHWRSGHFSAVLGARAQQLLVEDPAWGGRVWLDRRILERGSSGCFLIPAAALEPGWTLLGPDEAQDVRGGLVEALRSFDDDDEDCPNDEEVTSQPIDPDAPAPGDLTACPEPEDCPPGGDDEGCDGLGMPVWRVSEPFINLWVKDTPLFYTMSNGRVMPLTLRYKQRGSPPSQNLFGFGNSWTCSWLTYFNLADDGVLSFSVPGGGKRPYSQALGGSMRGERCEFVSCSFSSDGTASCTVSYRTHCFNQYTTVFAGAETNTLVLLTERRDPQGRVIRFHYTTNDTLILLARVVDYDGKATTLAYTNSQFPRFVTTVTDPYGRAAHFAYDTNGNLTQIVDVAGITNSFQYDAGGLLTALITPYGTTRFRSWDNDAANQLFPIDRSIEVTLPNGDRQVYAYHRELETDQVPDYYLDFPQVGEEVPEPVSVGPLNRRGSFFWNSRAMAAVTNGWPHFDPESYRLARWRCWDIQTSQQTAQVNVRLLMERAPSPDGMAEGHRLWYTYFYAPAAGVATIWPSQQAERLPDGTARYTRWDRNEWGRVTAIESTYSAGSGRDTRRTWLTYDVSGLNLMEVRGPELDPGAQPRLVRTYAYNARNQVTNVLNALGEVTSATYHPTNANLTSVTYPFGLRISNVLTGDGFLARRTWSSTAGQSLATNTFQWHQGRVRTSTDARGQIVTSFWDPLGRLTGRAYPDRTSVSNWYAKLDGIPYTNGTGGLHLMDRTRTRDRMGQPTSFSYDSLRRLVAVTNALGGGHRYAWCDCGALESVTDPLGNTTSCEHDHQGRLVAIHYPGHHTVRLARDFLGRPTNIADAVSAVTIDFNHQGLWSTLTTATGRRYRVEYDLLNRPVRVELPTGAEYELAYDTLGRISYRKERLSQGAERLGYSPNLPWPTSYTNEPGSSVTLLSYDALGRLTRRVQGGAQGGSSVAAVTNAFAYNSAGDLLSLTDGLNRTTSWQYDAYGRALRKLNAAGRPVWTNAYNARNQLVAEWTPARSGLTRYAYDALGRLTAIDFSATNTPDLALAYDAGGRITTMVDAAGTTRFTWDQLGTIRSEDGPWADDTVSFARDQCLLLRTISLLQPSGGIWTQGFEYDLDGRLTNLVAPSGTFAFAYLGSQPLVQTIARHEGAIITNTYDGPGRLTGTTLRHPDGTTLNRHAYDYGPAHERIRQTFADGNAIDYTYDSLGQLVGAAGVEPNGTPRRHEQFAYTYDRAGNLTRRQNDATFLTIALDLLNQITNAASSPTILVTGMTTPSATNVAVNGQSALLYADHTFVRPGFPLTAPATTITAVAQDALGRSASDTIAVPAPPSPAFTYDANGNLTSDGRRRFTYDDRNQLTEVVVTNAPNDSTLSQFVYDGLGRRRIRRESAWQTDRWLLTAETRYVYAGMLVLQERSATNQPTVTYTRGLDQSAELQQAGGIGGLLALTRHADAGSDHYYYHADAAGNVTALLDANSVPVAQYRYDPFGNLQGQRGPLAATNLYRFSTKEFHPPSGLYYYGFRFYDPGLQRWITPDPLEEQPDANLYRLSLNNPVSRIDAWGLASQRPPRLDLELRDPIQAQLVHNLRMGGRLDQLSRLTRDRLLQDLVAHGFTGRDTYIKAAPRDRECKLLPPAPQPKLLPPPPPKLLSEGVADTIAPGWRVSVCRLTMPNEKYIRYESDNAAYTRITAKGGVTPQTYAAPASDGLIPLEQRGSYYNLPMPEIPRTKVIFLNPPPFTPIIGPRPVSGGQGNEVLFPEGY